MTLRLQSTRDEVAAVARRLLQVLEVVSVSDPYPDRGASRLVRVHLEIRLSSAGAALVVSSGPVGAAKGRRWP